MLRQIRILDFNKIANRVSLGAAEGPAAAHQYQQAPKPAFSLNPHDLSGEAHLRENIHERVIGDSRSALGEVHIHIRFIIFFAWASVSSTRTSTARATAGMQARTVATFLVWKCAHVVDGIAAYVWVKLSTKRHSDPCFIID